MLGAVRATSARADDAIFYRRTPDPRWQGLIATADEVQFEPAEPFADLQLMEEVAWRAVAACRPVRYFYASREARTTRARIDADSRVFAGGSLTPTRLYVLLDGRPVAPALRSRIRLIDGIRVIPPSRPGPPPVCARAPRSAF